MGAILKFYTINAVIHGNKGKTIYRNCTQNGTSGITSKTTNHNC